MVEVLQLIGEVQFRRKLIDKVLNIYQSKIYQFYFPMELAAQYQTMTNNSECNIRQYITPALHCDPKQQILDRKYSDYKNQPKQKKFKATCRHKPCFMDQHIKPFVPNPSPDKYKMKEGFIPSEKQKRYKSADLKKIQPKITRGSYIDDIQHFQAKHKPPGIGKYDLLKQPFQDKHVNLRPKQFPRKFEHLDTVKALGAAVPGVGTHNPHKSVPHLKMNRTDYKFYQEKHAREEKKLKKSVSTKLGPSTYTPVKSDTFQAISKSKKDRSRWSHGSIDIRKGDRSKIKSPSPAQYRLINQWIPKQPRQRESDLGKVKLYERITQSTRAFSVYH